MNRIPHVLFCLFVALVADACDTDVPNGTEGTINPTPTPTCQAPAVKTYWLDVNWNDLERGLVIDQAEAWNAQAAELIGRRVMEYNGTFDDPDGPRPEDRTDGKSVVYDVDDEATYHLLHDPFDDGTGANVGGTGLADEIYIYVNHLYKVNGTVDQACFEFVVRHEFGHFQGLNHVKDPNALMYWTNSTMDFASQMQFKVSDRTEFCRVFCCQVPAS
ncbi:MAG: matrixin family metalloprotease [Patescibacteria group bacterium]|nr:matrixin family metalloprotease [Patescibacteria group bacterium]